MAIRCVRAIAHLMTRPVFIIYMMEHSIIWPPITQDCRWPPELSLKTAQTSLDRDVCKNLTQDQFNIRHYIVLLCQINFYNVNICIQCGEDPFAIILSGFFCHPPVINICPHHIYHSPLYLDAALPSGTDQHFSSRILGCKVRIIYISRMNLFKIIPKRHTILPKQKI